ncbi:MAG: ferric reductase-like transmembrane domain-containing protein [Opitutaceae bacterium]|nr:ferric reductase-like transmembrane domain-containing protein [Opitutaceae bacterium]
MSAFLEKLLRSKLTIWVLLVAPAVWALKPLFAPAPTDADPLKTTLLHLGLIGCIVLAAVLAFTPLRVLWPRWGVAQALNRHRRLVGVGAFAYALLHFTAHLLHVYDGGFGTFWKEIQKPFQLIGLGALLILFVLTITSINAAIRWLGGKAWKNLHRLAYVAAALAAWHQADARKIFPLQVVWIFGPLAVLEVARIWKQRVTSLPPPGTTPAQTS